MEEIVALLGRRDIPTDGVEDFTQKLRGAFERFGQDLKVYRVPWMDIGWPRALASLHNEAEDWRSRYVLVNYTALSWSKFGLPFWILLALVILRLQSAHPVMIFHDANGYPGAGFPSRIRRYIQHWVMRMAYGLAKTSIVPIPIDLVEWLRPDAPRAKYVPVGANIPARSGRRQPSTHGALARRTVAVFGVTEGTEGIREVSDLSRALNRIAAAIPIRLILVGRGSEEVAQRISSLLIEPQVECQVLGVRPPEEVSRVLSTSDALLFVRGGISTRRGSAMAGIACGVPVVAYRGRETGPPLTEAGIFLVPSGDVDALAEALSGVLKDDQLWRRLHQKNLEAQTQYFSWERIAESYIAALGVS